MAREKHKSRKTVLSLGIAILFVMFIGYAIETFYSSPNYGDYCGDFNNKLTGQFIQDEQQCLDVGGKWEENVAYLEDSENSVKGWCDNDFFCREDYDEAREDYNRIIFFFSLVVGLLTFVVSVSFLADAVSVGFMGGGILLIVYGNFGNLS